MARIRTIKPDFFIHDGLGELSPLHRLLFIGLWTMADKNGRLAYRPKKIKVQILPYDDDADVPILLIDLAKNGFIKIYQDNFDNDLQIIEVLNFCKHQVISTKEKELEVFYLPENIEDCEKCTGTVPGQYRDSTGTVPEFQERKGKEGKGMDKEKEEKEKPEVQQEEKKPRQKSVDLSELTIETRLQFKKLRRYLSQAIWDNLKKEFQAAGLTPEQGASLMIQKGWKNFEAAWILRKQNGTSAQPNSAPDKVRAAIRASYVDTETGEVFDCQSWEICPDTPDPRS